MEFSTHRNRANWLKRVTSILLLAVLAGCGNADAIDTTATKEDDKIVAIPVEAATVSSGDISSHYVTTAVLEAKEEAFVVARASGIIDAIYVEEGDYVEKGQVLAQLDPKRYELNVEKAKADLQGLQKELDKIHKVYSQRLVSDDTVDKLTAQHASAQALLALAELDLKEATIVAPISGFIAERNAKVGNLTESFQRERMFHIVQQRELLGIVHLPEKELANIQKDQQATLSIQAIGAAPVTAYVQRVSPVVNAQTGTFKVTLRVPNEQNRLMSGMFAEVSLQYATHQNATLLPRRALLSIDNKDSVFVVTDGVANKVDIVTGFQDAQFVEVLSGLSGTETVVTAGHHNLKDQSPVEVISAAAPNTLG
ncbi:efflux RND transporter periplasmic adaptor subunit [Alteromonas oceanisediminis]|uniref:efflux RND transporter periplasmic adaptor subunit n=1 Tax=Alteromonas oceanisediminis TaxID=2836180 RepID=UPI001BDB5353|nr:efflux RND transporter periplasmic adaptor subunit [Alteromonas oceanisediminis]MBT0586413.1 efflux RND transporter periplasmic adaptor subunit [Alteromonas oceanisediminis]